MKSSPLTTVSDRR